MLCARVNSHQGAGASSSKRETEVSSRALCLGAVDVCMQNKLLSRRPGELFVVVGSAHSRYKLGKLSM